jgi:dTDP-4-amino-4,6-dideoxygalactose transaminase
MGQLGVGRSDIVTNGRKTFVKNVLECRNPFKYKVVVPDVPVLEKYLPFLEEMHSNDWFSNFGPLALRFENQLLASFGGATETCVATSSATSGLSAAIVASGIRGKVLVPAFTFPASLAAVCAANLEPVVTDVDYDTWAMSVQIIASALEQTRASAVMLVAPFGMRRNFHQEIAYCRQRRISVIVDNAAGLGIPRVPLGIETGVFEVFSLHATKPFAVGEGGVVFANLEHDEAMRAAINFALRTHGQPEGPMWGFNGKMSEFHAAIALAQLKQIGDNVRARQAFAADYMARLAGLPDVIAPSDPSLAPWQIFPLLVPTKQIADEAQRLGTEAGLEIRRYYRPSLSRWPGIHVVGPCRVAEDLAERMCTLPVRSTVPETVRDEMINIAIDVLSRAVRIRIFD